MRACARERKWSASPGRGAYGSCRGRTPRSWAPGSAGRRSRRSEWKTRPKRRRRTAAEVAVAEAEAQAEAAIEAERELKAREALEAAKAVDDEEKPSLEERAAALFKDLPAAEESRAEPSFAAPPTATAAPAAPPPSAASFGAPPRQVIPTPVR